MGWCRGLTDVVEDVAHDGGVGDGGDVTHFATTVGAAEREHFVDSGEQQRPGLAGSATMSRFGGGLRIGWRRRGRRGLREGGACRAQR